MCATKMSVLDARRSSKASVKQGKHQESKNSISKVRVKRKKSISKERVSVDKPLLRFYQGTVEALLRLY